MDETEQLVAIAVSLSKLPDGTDYDETFRIPHSTLRI
jgi:hypothetical protein